MGSKKTKDNAEPQGASDSFRFPKRPSGVSKAAVKNLEKVVTDLLQQARDEKFARDLNREGPPSVSFAPVAESDSRPFLKVGKGGKAIKPATNGNKGVVPGRSFSSVVQHSANNSHASQAPHSSSWLGPSQAGVKPASSAKPASLTGAGSGPRHVPGGAPSAATHYVDLTKDVYDERRVFALQELRAKEKRAQDLARDLASFKKSSLSIEEIAQKDAECEAMIKRVSAEFADARQVLAARQAAEASARALAALTPIEAAKAKVADAEAQGERLKKELQDLEDGDNSEKVSALEEQARRKILENKGVQEKIDASRARKIDVTAKKSGETSAATQGPVSLAQASVGASGKVGCEDARGNSSSSSFPTASAGFSAGSADIPVLVVEHQAAIGDIVAGVDHVSVACRKATVDEQVMAAVSGSPPVMTVDLGEATGTESVSAAASSVASPVIAGSASTADGAPGEGAAVSTGSKKVQLPSEGPAVATLTVPGLFRTVSNGSTESVTGSRKVQVPADGPVVGLRSRADRLGKGPAPPRSAPGSDDDDDPDPGSNAALRN